MTPWPVNIDLNGFRAPQRLNLVRDWRRRAVTPAPTPRLSPDEAEGGDREKNVPFKQREREREREREQ